MRDTHAVLKSILRRVGLSLVGAALLGQTLSVAAQVVVPNTPNPVLTKTMTPPRPKIGEPARIAITATNAGPVNAENVVITDPLPDNIALNSVTTTQGSVAIEHHIITVYVGTLAPGQTVMVTNEVVIIREFASDTPWTNCTGLTYRDGVARLACFPYGPAYGPVSTTTPPRFLPEAGAGASLGWTGLLVAGMICLLIARRLRRPCSMS